MIRIPPIRLELAATLSASPFTALRLLSDFAQLSFGDVVLHNDAGSPVGTAIAQIAHSRGIRTISIVAESAPNYGPTVERLKLMGADVVIGEAYLDTTGFGAVLKDMPAPKLAINGGNANSSALLAGLMPKGCKMVTYCPGDADAEVLNKADVTNSQFSLPDWLATAKRSDVETMVSTLTDMIQEGKFTAWLQRVKFDELPSAIEEGGAYKRKLVAIMDNATQS